MSKQEFWQRIYLAVVAKGTPGVNPKEVADNAIADYERMCTNEGILDDIFGNKRAVDD